jgi:antirestriction protein ArdC
MPSNKEIREAITQQLIKAIENGSLPWRRPWKRSPNAGRSANIASGKAYRGINPILLQLHQAAHGFNSKWWGTFQQWKSLGCTVMKRPDNVESGKWGCPIVFYKPLTKKVVKNGKEEKQEFFLMKTFTVFNADQVVGADKWQVQEDTQESSFDAYEPAEELIRATGAKIEVGGSDAFYAPATDTIHMPHQSTFTAPAAYYHTVFHELAHWTEKRLDCVRNEADSYAFFELVAELTSTYVAQEVGVPVGESLDNHAAYLKHWLSHMKNDSNYIFKATQQASKATDYLLSFVGKTEAVLEEVAA